MRITKNGFYKLSELVPKLGFQEPILREEIININVDDNIIVMFFDDLNQNIDMKIGENSRVEFYGVIENIDNFNINFLQNKKSSNLIVRYLLLSKNNEKIKTKIYSKLSSNNTKSDIHIISIVGNDGFIDLDGIIEIDKNIEKVDGKLLEENIFLGTTGKVKGLPTLLVRSNDVKASHACRIERINDEKIFYLRSRGIGKENSIFMMIESYILTMFKCISMVDKLFYKELLENIIKKV